MKKTGTAHRQPLFLNERRENNKVKTILSLADATISRKGVHVNDYDKEFTNCSQGVSCFALDCYREVW